MILITSKQNLDFEYFSCMVGLSKIEEEAILYFNGKVQKPLKKFLSLFNNEFIIYSEKDIDFSKVKKIIIIGNPKDTVELSKIKNNLKGKKVEIVIYTDEENLKEKYYKEKNITVICTQEKLLLYFLEEIIRRKIIIKDSEALLFLLGIYYSTQNFTSLNTDYKDFSLALYLFSKNIDKKLLFDFLRETFDLDQIKLFNRLIKNMQVVENKGYKFIITYARFKNYITQLSEIVEHIMKITNSDGIVAIVQMENKIFVIGRSRDENLNIRKIISGGGYKTQSAVVLNVKKNISIKKIKDEVYNKFIAIAGEKYTAKDIMSTPVIAIDTNLTMEEAYKVCIRFNINGLPVVENNKLTGFITKSDIEKSLHHGLRDIKIKAYMSTNLISIKPDTSIKQAQQLMLKYNINYLPVVENNELKGIITKSDILSFLYEERPIKKEKFIFKEKDINIKEIMIKNIKLEDYELIRKIGELADEYGINAYLVGGIVRDLFLKREDMDIDITVEGDGISFAKFIADKIGGAYKGFERFKTAKVFLKNKRIDITSARAEFYEYPAALPEVEFTAIRYDLYRRDFTINAMAIKINKNEFGKFIDYFNGYEDLKNKLIKTLYNMSFVDDPTRILRAIRFETRFNFKIEENTLRFIKETLKYNVFDTLPGERLRDEFFLIFEEKEPYKSIKRLDEFGVIKHLNPHLYIDDKVEYLFKEIEKIDININYEKLIIYTLCFLYYLNINETEKFINKLKLKKYFKKAILSGKRDYEKINLLLEKENLKNSRIYEILKNYKTETLLYFYILFTKQYKKQYIRKYLLELKNIKINVKGEDLKGIGLKEGPLYSEIMKKLLFLKLDGKINTKEEEINFIKRVKKGS